MIEAGLLIHGEGIAVPYDRFRDRVMFPIHDRAGRVIAFGGRAMEPGAKAKYLNSPETPLFHKGSLLFNHHRARKAAHDSGEIVVVEGYVDAIAMSEAGFPHVVAPLGTALTADQCALLWTMADEPILCFDGDNAGRKAAFRAIETALPLIGAGKSLRFALLPEGQDPDDLIRAGRAGDGRGAEGRAAFRRHAVFARARGQAARHAREPRGAGARLCAKRCPIADETLRKHYQADMRRRLGALFGDDRPAQPGRRGGGRRGGGGRGPARRPASPRGPRSAWPRRRSRRTSGSSGGPRSRRAQDRDPGDRARPSGADRGAVRGPRDPRIRGRQARRVPRRPARRAGRRRSIRPRRWPEALRAAGRGRRARAHSCSKRQRRRPGGACAPKPRRPTPSMCLRQSLALHRRAGALNRELKLAERSLAEEPNERNFARLLDIKAHLADLAPRGGSHRRLWRSVRSPVIVDLTAGRIDGYRRALQGASEMLNAVGSGNGPGPAAH